MKASLYFIAAPAAAAASCSASDQHTLMHMDVNDIGKKANDCGAEAYSMFTGAFNRDTFNSCFTKAVSISNKCSECYADSGEYGAKNCKAACLLGWCKQGCLDCTAPATKKVAECVGKGMQFDAITPCLESATASSCSNGDRHTLASMDVNDIGKKANDCGAEAYSVLTGAFNRDTFNNCFTKKMSISESCSECYADSGEYGAKNCKAACLLGWCKQGCLDCTAPATKKVAECVGDKVHFEPVSPCLEAEVGDGALEATIGAISLSWEPGTCKPNLAILQDPKMDCSKISSKTPCTHSDNQCLWEAGEDAGAPVLVNPASGKCLDVSNPKGLSPKNWADETQVQVFRCNGAKGQEWILRDGALINPASGKCLDIYNPTELLPHQYEDETKVQLHTCKGNANQQWALVNQGPERQQLVNLPSGKCLDIYSPKGDLEDDTQVQLFTCGGNQTNQQWRFALVNRPEEMMV
jgi:hypothetical protein